MGDMDAQRQHFGARSTAKDVLAGVDLTGRRILVTGGTSGLGRETSLALRDAGAQVIAGVRTVGAADVPGVLQEPLDLSQLSSVRAFAERWVGPLDVVVANAGVMAIPDRRTSPEGWELQMATNYLGHFALVLGLRRALAAGAGGRVVFVSSGAHRAAPVDLSDLHFERRAYDPWLAYGQSKSATILAAVALAERWADDGVMANALNPGYIMTGLQRHVDDDTMRALGAMDDDGNLVEADYYKTPAQGAATSALLAGSPEVDGVSGAYFEDCRQAAVAAEGDDGVAPHAVDLESASRLWDAAMATISYGQASAKQ